MVKELQITKVNEILERVSLSDIADKIEAVRKEAKSKKRWMAELWLEVAVKAVTNAEESYNL